MSSSVRLLLTAALVLAPAGVADAKKKPKGPSVAVAKRAIAGVLREGNATAAVPPENVILTFNSPVKVLKARKVNPNEAGNVNDAGGKINVWPVRTNITIVLPQDDTPEDDTYCAGTWVNEQFVFYRDSNGKWAWYGDSIDYSKGLPDKYGPNAPCV